MNDGYSGDPFDLQNMSDNEIREVVLEQLRDSPNLDPEDIDVTVREGAVTLSGRVGTDSEVQIASAMLGDVLGIEEFSNELVVDELRRGLAPEAGFGDEGLEDPDMQQTDTAQHLVVDLEAETFGTDDVGESIRDGTSYSPPDRPTSDGYGSRENH